MADTKTKRVEVTGPPLFENEYELTFSARELAALRVLTGNSIGNLADRIHTKIPKLDSDSNLLSAGSYRRVGEFPKIMENEQFEKLVALYANRSAEA